jgi:hypothetical protein
MTILLNYRIVLVIKDRQVGVSWEVSGFTDWEAEFHSKNALGLFISKKEKDAWKLLAKSRFIHLNLPVWLRLPENHNDSRELIDFKDIESSIEVQTSTADAGRGTDATIVVRDECAFHPYAEENLAAVQPAVDAGGRRIDISTIDPWSEENHFTKLILKNLDGATKTNLSDGMELYFKPDSDTAVVYIPWTARPTRREGMTQQEFWDKVIVPNYDEIQRQSEYSGSLENALKPPKITCRFDADAIAFMKARIDSPFRVERNGIVRFYGEPELGHRYAFIVDPSDAAEDPSTGIIVDVRTNFKVADFRGMLPITDQMSIIQDLHARFFEPTLVIERNKSALVEMVAPLNLRNVYKQTTGKGQERLGWYTGTNRGVMLSRLAEVVRLKLFTDLSKDSLSQFASFIRIAKNQDGEARKGAHDDFVMCWAIYFQIKDSIPIGETRAVSFKYRG